jgi:urease accessory protein UreE
MKFKEMLETMQAQMNNDYDEIISAAHLIGNRPNYLTVDEHGFFHVQASGKIEEVMSALKIQLEKLDRISKQKQGI